MFLMITEWLLNALSSFKKTTIDKKYKKLSVKDVCLWLNIPLPLSAFVSNFANRLPSWVQTPFMNESKTVL